MFFSPDEQSVVERDRGCDDALAHVVLAQDRELIADPGHENDAVLAGGVEIAAGDEGGGVVVRAASREFAGPKRLADGRGDALDLAAVVQEVDAASVRGGCRNEAAGVAAF